MTDTNRGRAHWIVDFLWDRVHISAGAFVLVLISFLFTAAVYRIDQSDIAHSELVGRSVCHVVAGLNASDASTRARLTKAIHGELARAKSEDGIAAVWEYALRHNHGNRTQIHLITRLIHSEHVLAAQDRSTASDLKYQRSQVKPLTLGGC